MTRHLNNGRCPKCVEIFDRFPGAHQGLRTWFFQEIQKKTPDAHVSCVGRGRADQEDAFKKGTSKAQYGQSAHNYNVAIDIFKLHLNGAEWPRDWFKANVGPAVARHNQSGADFKLNWYGAPGSKFFELPHVEILNWRDIKTRKLVE
jgi:hypothetical protein